MAGKDTVVQFGSWQCALPTKPSGGSSASQPVRTHTAIECVAPRGFGERVPVQVSVVGRRSVSSSGSYFS